MFCFEYQNRTNICPGKRNIYSLISFNNTANALSHDLETRSCNQCCSGKAISITFSERVFVALVIQHVVLMQHITICGLHTLHYFSTSHKRHDFRK